MRVLILEDDLVLAGIVTEFLTSEGHTAVPAPDPGTAMRLASENQWDVCIADSSPRSNGKLDDADRAIFAALARYAPVILATGRAWAHHVDPSDVGVAAIVGKPFDLFALLAAVDSAGALGKAGV